MLTKKQRVSAYGLLMMMLFGMLIETLSIGLVVPVVSLMMQNDLTQKFQWVKAIYAYFNNPSQSQILVGILVILLLIYFVKNIYLALLAWKQAKFAYSIQRDTSQLLFNSYLNQPYSFHLQRNTAQLIRNTIGEVTIFTAAINSHLTLIAEMLVLVGIIVLLIFVQPLGALLVTTMLGIASFLFFKLTKNRLLKWGKARQFHEGMRLQHLQQGLGAVKDVLLMGRERNFQEQYSLHNAESAKAACSQYALQQMPRLWLEFLAILGLALLVIVMLGQKVIMATLLPTLALFAASAFRLIPSANKIITSLQSLRFSLPVINNLHNEITSSRIFNDTKLEANELFSKELNSEISVNQLSFSYPNVKTEALRQISLHVKKGESVGIIGASGSGKSTLIDILMGLLTPASGEVLVDGLNINSNMRRWQQQIGYVPQAIYLTDNTLRRNIAFGLADADIDEAAVIGAMKSAQLDEFISTLPQGLDTTVGERGIKLSGGQRQRIGIARALYHEPNILVFDEATSALDNATEAEVIKAIEFLHGSKTIVIIAHRLSTVAHCDRIYKMHAGKVVSEEIRQDTISSNIAAPSSNS